MKVDLPINLMLLHTTDIELAQRFSSVKNLQAQGKALHVDAYVATSENALKGLIHNVRPDATPEPLMRYLSTPVYKMLYAGRLGASHTAQVTFAGRKRLPTIRYYNAIQRCYP